MNAMGCNIKGGGLLMLLFFLDKSIKVYYVCNRERTSLYKSRIEQERYIVMTNDTLYSEIASTLAAGYLTVYGTVM